MCHQDCLGVYNGLSKFEKAYARFMAKPTPKDIEPDELTSLAKNLGFLVSAGGKHPIILTDPESKESFAVPIKNGLIKPFYVAKLQQWFLEKREDEQN